MSRNSEPISASLDERLAAAKQALGKTSDGAVDKRTDEAAHFLRPRNAAKRRVEVPLTLTAWERSTLSQEASRRGVSLDFVLREKLGLSR